MDNKLYTTINSLYNKKTYSQRYFGSIILTVVLFLLFFLLISYYYVKNKTIPIKSNWTKYKCSPLVIPFAGLINAEEGESILKFTSNNFTYCINNILMSILSDFLQPINDAVSVNSKIFGRLKNGINATRGVLSNVRNGVTNIGDNIYNRIINIMIPLQNLLIRSKAIMAKGQGVLTAGLFTSFGTYMTLQSAIGAIYDLIVIILVALAASIVIMWLIPFTWAAAATMTGIFVAISIPLAMMGVVMHDIFKVKDTSGIPSKPSCFDENTILYTDNDIPIKIKYVKPNMILKDIGKINAIFKLDATNEIMYSINKVIVSGSHKINYKKNWIYVKDHPNADKITNYNKKYIYCLNSSSKNIIINNTNFTDWDEMYPHEYLELSNKLKRPINKRNLVKLDNGFSNNFELILLDGSCKKIDEIKINDILQNGEHVVGLVKLDGSDKLLYSYNNCNCIGSKTIHIYNNSQFNTLNEVHPVDILFRKNNIYIYHILTNKGFFKQNDIIYLDYSSNIDVYLKKESGELKHRLQTMYK